MLLYSTRCCWSKSYIQELSLSGGREIMYVEMWVIPHFRNGRIDANWEKKVAGEISKVTPLDLRDWRTRESPWRILAKIQDVPDRAQHRCNRAVFEIWSSTARRKRTVYGSFRSEDSRCGATPLLLLRDCVRVISFGTGSQHIPDLEQHFYHMQENSFVRFDNPDLKQHRCYGTVYVLNRLCIMYYYEFGLFCVAFIL